jgi:hypothetical protein
MELITNRARPRSFFHSAIAVIEVDAQKTQHRYAITPDILKIDMAFIKKIEDVYRVYRQA